MRSFVLAGMFSAGVLCLGLNQTYAAKPTGQPAQIHVTLPPHATLMIDGQPTKSTSAQRWFETPPLAPGKTFYYDLQARVIQDGKTITVEQRVPVTAGQETNVSLNLPGQTGVASRYGYLGSGLGAAYYFGPEIDNAAIPSAAFPTPGVRGYYVPYNGYIQGYRLNGVRTPAGGFHPLRWGTSPSDPFYPMDTQ